LTGLTKIVPYAYREDLYLYIIKMLQDTKGEPKDIDIKRLSLDFTEDVLEDKMHGRKPRVKIKLSEGDFRTVGKAVEKEIIKALNFFEGKKFS
jgi:hypothetical protein